MLPESKKNERSSYSGCVLTAEAEWSVKLQMRDRSACSDYVLAAENADDRQARLQRLRTCVCRLKRMALPQARPAMLCIH